MVRDDCVRELVSHEDGVNAVSLTSDGNFCLTASNDRSVKLWNPHRDDSSFHQPQPFSRFVSNNSRSGSGINTSSSSSSAMDGSKRGLLIKTYAGNHGYEILDVAVFRDNSRFVSAGGDKACFLMDVTSGRVIRRIQSHTAKINSVDLNDDGTVLMSGSYDQSVCLWDLRASNRDPLQTLRDCKDSVTSITHTDQEIIVGSLDKTLRIYDLRRGLCHSDDMTQPITCVRLTHDRKSVVSTCLGGQLHLTDISTGKLMQTYQNGHIHKNYKLEACVEVDDQHIVACSEDGSVCHYNLVSGQVVYRSTQCHFKAIGSISYHPKDKFFITASYDGTVKCWNSMVE